jgi:chromatin remodeling complex protein RSC6
VAEAAPATDAAVTATQEDDVVAQLNSTIAALEEQISTLQAGLRTAVASVKSVQKLAARVVKKAGKRRAKKARDPSKPSEFEKPKQVTDELCAFLGVAKGTLITRADVTRGVTNYAKTRGLMDKQKIKADAPLRKLLGVSESDELSILTLQKFLKHHYIKAAPVAN